MSTTSFTVYIINCVHISNFLLFIDFEKEKVFWVHIRKINTFEYKIGYLKNINVGIQFNGKQYC